MSHDTIGYTLLYIAIGLLFAVFILNKTLDTQLPARLTVPTFFWTLVLWPLGVLTFVAMVPYYMVKSVRGRHDDDD